MSEVDTSGGFDQAVEISLLNDVPDVLRDEVKSLVLSLNLRPQGREFLERLGFWETESDDNRFKSDGVVYCSEIDNLISSMRCDDRLTPRLEDSLNKLRAHFGAMSCCLIDFSFVYGSKGAQFHEKEGILREKIADGMYLNDSILIEWMGDSTNADSFRRIYEFTKDYSKNGPVHKLSEGFFEIWASSFFNCAEDFVVLCEALKEEGVSVSIPFRKWINCVKTYDQLKGWVFFMISDGKIPDERAIGVVRNMRGNGSVEFKNWIKEMFCCNEAANLVSAAGWRAFFDAV